MVKRDFHKWINFFKKVSQSTLNELDESTGINTNDSIKVDSLFKEKSEHIIHNMTSNSIDVYEKYDMNKECERLRKEDEINNKPFINGELLWNNRRKLWLIPNKSIEPIPIITIDNGNDKIFKSIPENYYPRIYNKLIMEDKPLKRPLNLSNAIKVIDSGWTETKKWDNAAKGIA